MDDRTNTTFSQVCLELLPVPGKEPKREQRFRCWDRVRCGELSSQRSALTELALLLIVRNLRQHRRLELSYAFRSLPLPRLDVDRLAGRVDQPGGDKDNQVALDVLLELVRKSRPTSGMSPMIGVRSSVFCTSSRINPPRTTVWPSHTLTLVVTLRELKIGWLITLGVMNSSWSVTFRSSGFNRGRCKDRAAIVDESFELDHLRHQIQIDRHAIRTHHRFDFQGHAGVAGLKAGGGGWSDRHRSATRQSGRSCCQRCREFSADQTGSDNETRARFRSRRVGRF